MNNTSNFNSYSTSQPSSSNSNSNDYLAGILASGALLIILSIAIFIIWVWSMISMISLNGRFKEFYDDYQRKEAERKPIANNSSVYSEAPAAVSGDAIDDNTQASWLSKKPSTTSVVILLTLVLILGAILIYSLG